MPKTEIDYSNTIIYKITCKDKTITDVYVGHTTNFVQRKHAHKQSCLNSKSANHTCKLYEVIRTNGGWENWKMEIINFFNCEDNYAARKKEQEYFIELKATLNSIEPLPKPKVIQKNNKIIDVKPNLNCNIQSDSLNSLNKHIKIIGQSTTNEQNTTKLTCELCHIKCCRPAEMNRHLSTRKHKRNESVHNLEVNLIAKKIYQCLCGKKYNTHSGLWKHKKLCVQNKNIEPSESEVKILTNLMFEIVKTNSELKKQNQEFQKQIMELYKTTNDKI
jgi:hypothetical protein